MNTKLRKKDKNDFKKDFFKLNNTVFENNLENVRNHRDIKLVKKYKKRKKKEIRSCQSLTTIQQNAFWKNWWQLKWKNKNRNKYAIYLGLSILEISKIAMYDYWYEYRNPIYKNMAKLCYMHKDSFIIHVKTADIYADLAGEKTSS